MRKLILAIVALTSTAALAATILTWTAPIEREDGTTLLPGEIAGYNIYCGLVTGAYDTVTYFKGNIEQIDAALLDRPAGYSFCKISTVDTDGRESVLSANEVIIETIVDSAPPKPPYLPEGAQVQIILPWTR